MAGRGERRIAARDPFLGDLLEAFPRVYSRDFLDAFWGRGRGSGEFPAVDVCEDDQRYIVTAELPGVSREAVSVELSSGVLTIHGEKKSERAERDERRRFAERAFGAFTRSFTLPEDADGGRIDASFQDGVLTITIAKRAERKARTIDVKAG